MNFTQVLDISSTWFIKIAMPVVASYHFMAGNIFLNTAAEEAYGLEKMANDVLIPFQYLFAGHVAICIAEEEHEGHYELKQRFDYQEGFFIKTTSSVLALPASVVLGSALKGLAYCFPETRERHALIAASLHNIYIESNIHMYEDLGIKIVDVDTMEKIDAPQYAREPGAENKLKHEKALLKEISLIFKEYQIPYWVDCGTCLGAYRYGGVIPWDFDIDISVLEPDFENVRSALNALDPDKYTVQDWSSRDKPCTYIRIYIKETRNHLDLYHFKIDADDKTIQYIISNEGSAFLPESWKKRERSYAKKTPFDIVFPLKRASFDGFEVLVPNKTKEYLQMRYGENIAPVKLYDSKTGAYEKDPSHPYWKASYSR
jgi:phosphorylcholine metabolism protein LicD